MPPMPRQDRVGRLGPRHREIWFGSYGDWSGGPERELKSGGLKRELQMLYLLNRLSDRVDQGVKTTVLTSLLI